MGEVRPCHLEQRLDGHHRERMVEQMPEAGSARDLFPRACGANEDQKRLCPLNKIGVPPVKP